MVGEDRGGEAEAAGHDQRNEEVGYTDGSRFEGVAAGATAESGLFLGDLPTVIDAEMVGIAGALEEGYSVVGSDSQVATGRCLNLACGAQVARPWIDEKAVKALKGLEGKATLMCVKGHSGVEGNELADKRARDWVMKGQ